MTETLSYADKRFFDENGYVVVKGVYSPEEVAFYVAHYMDLRARGTHPGDLSGIDLSSNDPLKKYPRMLHMHHWDEVSLKWLLDARLNGLLTGLLGREPLAVQTMLYFKPAGARGQALHQDNFYLRVKPGTCMAAWMALDPCDTENGCMQVVPKSHKWDLLCPTRADTSQSFTDVTVPLPEGSESVPVVMDAGDVLFFNGTVVHGSFPNVSKDRFRRSLIGHYIEGNSKQVATFYDPVYRMNGERVTVAPADEGGKCGVWVDVDGRPEIELQEKLEGAGATQ